MMLFFCLTESEFTQERGNKKLAAKRSEAMLLSIARNDSFISFDNSVVKLCLKPLTHLTSLQYCNVVNLKLKLLILTSLNSHKLNSTYNQYSIVLTL
jgi:hypothetical protein